MRRLGCLIALATVLLLPALALAGPLAPLAPSGTIPATTEVTLTWQAVSGATAYMVRAADATDSTVNTLPGGLMLRKDAHPTTSIVLPVTPGHGYSWWVHSVSNGVASPAEGAMFTVATATEPVPPAPAPTATLTLRWTDNATNEDGVGVERFDDAALQWREIDRVGVDVVTYANTALPFETRFCYRVRAFNAAGLSAYSNEACGTTPPQPPPPPPPPAAPSGLTVADGSTTDAPTSQVTVGPMMVAAATNQKPFGWPDGTMGVERQSDGTYRFTGAHTRFGNRCRGTLAAPTSLGCEGEKLTQGMPVQYRYGSGGPVYRDPASGTLILFQHLEQWDGDNHGRFYTSGGLAKSTDDGATWQWLGEIIRYPIDFSDPTAYFTRFPPSGGEAIQALPYIVKGGFFYVYHGDHLADGTYVRLTVSRARVADVVAWATGGPVATFAKYFNGAFTEPGVGGRSTSLIPNEQDMGAADVIYNAVLGKYVMIGMDGWHWPRPPVVWLESSDGITWTNFHVIVPPDEASRAYITLAGHGPDPKVAGAQFSLYYIRSVAEGAGTGPRNSDAQLVRHIITVEPGA